MYFQRNHLFFLPLLMATFLNACQDNKRPLPSAGDTEVAETSKDKISNQDINKRLTGLQNPDWTIVETLPAEWTGLYQKDCEINGPEKTSFFTYNNHLQNTQYHITYIVFPTSLDRKPKAEIYPFTFKVWQNKNLQDHYLLFAEGGFSQILIEDGISRGLHQTLDNQPWDLMANFETRYKPTDTVRWATDIDNPEDYGSRPPCDQKLAQPWDGQIFKTKSGTPFTLKDIMTAP